MDGVQPALTMDDVIESEIQIKANPEFLRYMRERYGVTDMAQASRGRGAGSRGWMEAAVGSRPLLSRMAGSAHRWGVRRVGFAAGCGGQLPGRLLRIIPSGTPSSCCPVQAVHPVFSSATPLPWPPTRPSSQLLRHLPWSPNLPLLPAPASPPCAQVACDPWYSGIRYGHPDGRIMQFFLYLRSNPDDLHYAHPLDTSER